ncbi:MAG: hypothetical protein MI919_22395 [Holophagales bacterium]|nr:hypothetical protein [Holophagales bacterium]
MALPGECRAAAKPDVVYVVAGTTSTISFSLLTENDEFSGEADVSIVDPDDYDNIEEGSTSLLFDASGGIQRRETFAYQLTDSTGTSVAVVEVVIVPSMQPVAGRWPVERPHPGQPCSDGDGSEIGFYDATADHFVLCDFQGGGVRDCKRWIVPSVGSSSTGTPGHRLPVIGDWDGDGWDQPGLFDPDTAELELFDYGEPCRGEMCLVSAGFVATGLGRTEYPLSAPGSAGTALAGYDWVVSRLMSGSGAGMEIDWSAPAPWPVLADWFGTGTPLLGEWSSEIWTFRFLGDPDGVTSNSLLATDPRGNPATGIPFVGRWSRCSSEAYFGLLQTEIGYVGLFTPVLILDDRRPPVHVKIPVDPPA